MRHPPVQGLRAFEAAARHESFAVAATELKLTAAAVSQHVRGLEAWLGTALFKRHARGVTLTAAGRDFGAAVSQGLGHIAHAAELIVATSRRGPVGLACLPSVTTRWLIPRLAVFRSSHPDIRLAILYALDARTPQEAGAELLIQHGARPRWPASPILSAATRATCSPDYLARHGPFATPQALLCAELLHDETPAAWARWFSAAGVDVSPAGGPIYADFNLLIGAVLAGQGVGLCPTALIGPELESGRLIELFDQASDLDKWYWLLEAEEVSSDAMILRDWLMTMSRTDGLTAR